MDFLSTLLIYAKLHNISADDVTIRHQNYCQNLYFQPDAEQKMGEAHCNIYDVATEISRVKSGRY